MVTTSPTRLVANCSILFTELPWWERPAAAAAHGFTAVEFWWPFATAVPAEDDLRQFIDCIGEAGVRLTGLNFFAGDMPAGDRGILSHPSRVDEFTQNVSAVSAIARATGCQFFNALYGNRLEGVSPEHHDETALENLARLAHFTQDLNATVMLEPVSGVEAYPLKTADDVMAVLDRAIERSVATRLGLLADFYHLATNGDDVPSVINRYAERIVHVQIADAPGRGEPGSGNLPLAAWLRALDARGYDGRIALEYRPTASSNESFAWLGTI
jgi:hydroxypyruvate isomerase